MKVILANSDFEKVYQDLIFENFILEPVIITDLPYNITQNKIDIKLDLNLLWETIGWKTPMISTAANKFTFELINSNFKNWGYNLIWKKNLPTGFLNAKRRPLQKHEDIVIFNHLKTCYNPQMTIATPEQKKYKKKTGSEPIKHKNWGHFIPDKTKEDDGTRYPVSVIEFKTPKVDLVHATQKPIEMYEWLIKTYSKPDNWIIDITAGSGTTCIAANNLGQNCICIERDPEIYQIMKERLERNNILFEEYVMEENEK